MARLPFIGSAVATRIRLAVAVPLVWGSRYRRGGLVLAAFLLWAANQLLADSAHATLLNDLAIALFVLDVFLSIIGWPPAGLGRPDREPLDPLP